MKLQQFSGVEYSRKVLEQGQEHIISRTTKIRHEDFTITKADGTEIPFKDLEGLPQNLDPQRNLKRKSKYAPDEKVASTKRKKSTPRWKRKSKSGKTTTADGDQTGHEANESPSKMSPLRVPERKFPLAMPLLPR
jgi:hypothetical protein